jgi:hypothetical protein
LRVLSFKRKKNISEIVNQFTEEGLQNAEELEVMTKPNSIGIIYNGNDMLLDQQGQEQGEQKQQQQTSGDLKITLGHKVLGRLDWVNILANVDDPHILQACITSGKMLSVAAQERLSEVQTQKRLEARGIVGDVRR